LGIYFEFVIQNKSTFKNFKIFNNKEWNINQVLPLPIGHLIIRTCKNIAEKHTVQVSLLLSFLYMRLEHNS